MESVKGKVESDRGYCKRTRNTREKLYHWLLKFRLVWGGYGPVGDLRAAVAELEKVASLSPRPGSTVRFETKVTVYGSDNSAWVQVVVRYERPSAMPEDGWSALSEAGTIESEYATALRAALDRGLRADVARVADEAALRDAEFIARSLWSTAVAQVDSAFADRFAELNRMRNEARVKAFRDVQAQVRANPGLLGESGAAALALATDPATCVEPGEGPLTGARFTFPESK